jgi:hypothetical protein
MNVVMCCDAVLYALLLQWDFQTVMHEEDDGRGVRCLAQVRMWRDERWKVVTNVLVRS